MMRRFVCAAVALSAWVSIAAADSGWRTTARWHRTLEKAVTGTVLIDEDGIEFRSGKLSHRWAFDEIHTFDVSLREFTLWTYQRRPLHEPGERPFHFTLDSPMPAEVAARLTERVQKPVRDGAPVRDVQALFEIPAHRRTWSGGSNGTLRLRDDGLDYVTIDGRDSHSWRWADIQTIANPNPYELRVAAYREVVEFDLKKPLPRPLFERMWDKLYAVGLNLSVTAPGELQ